jgi:undecaprenyl-diphosphatase
VRHGGGFAATMHKKIMNETIFRYFNNFAGQYEWLDTAVVFSAETLGIILLFGLVIFLFSHEHKGRGFHNVIVVLTAGLVAWIFAKIIKTIYPSPRPFLAIEDVTKLVNHGGTDSFPSGHTTFFSAIATALYFYHKKIAVFYMFGALLIGLSRIVAGIHWPVDILAGYVLGGVVTVFVYYSYQYILRRFIRH